MFNIAYLVIGLVYCGQAAPLPPDPNPGFRDPNDPIIALVNRYAAESKAIHFDKGPDPHREFFELWLQRFKAALAEHPESPHAQLARERITEILNSYARFPEALAMLEERLQFARSAYDEEYLTYQIGLAAHDAYFITKDVAIARKSLEAFERYWNLAREHQGAAYIDSLSKAGTMEAAAFEHFETAAELYAQAAAKLPEARRLSPQELTYRPYEEILRQWALRYFVRAGKPERVMEQIEGLSASPDREFPMGHYYRMMFAEVWDYEPEEGEVLIELCTQWLRRHPDDPQSTDLNYELAGWYESHRQVETSIAMYEMLLERLPGAELSEKRRSDLRQWSEQRVKTLRAHLANPEAVQLTYTRAQKEKH